MDLETVIQNKVSQKEKNKYHISTHICGIYKNGTDQSFCKAERHREQTYGHQGGKGGVG